MAYQIDSRLFCIAQSVRKSACVADIGTDHAYLPIYLIRHNISPFVYAVDISANSCKKAQENIEKSGFSDKIKVIQGNGLTEISEHDVSDIVIAGIGGRSIISIIDKAEWLKKKSGHKLILGPNTSAHELRKWLCLAGFTITYERAIFAAAPNSKMMLYTIISAEFTGDINEDKGFYHTGLLHESGGIAGLEYLKNERSRLEKSAEGFKLKNKWAAYSEAMSLIDYINKKIKLTKI